MTLDPQARTLLDLMAAIGTPPLEASTPDEARASRRAVLRLSDEPVYDISEPTIGSVRTRRYQPNADATTAIVWLHGGGWVLGDLDSHDGLCRTLANESGAVVFSVDYRLAPEHPFPAGLSDAIETTRLIAQQAVGLGIDPNRMAIGGDSAGGNLAAVVAQLGVAPLAAQVLAYPVTDCRMETQSYSDLAEGYFLTRSAMNWFYNHYAPDVDRRDPRVSPGLVATTSLTGLPPTLVITCEYDPLRDEGDAYADALNAAGVDVTHRHLPGLIHGALSMAAQLDGGRQALIETSRWLATALT
jgi:acetyl esterase